VFFDEIVIGSGLAALGVVLRLPANRRVLVIGGLAIGDVDALMRAGVNGPTSRAQVVDASVLRDIGPDHHSFKVMIAAYPRAHVLTQSE
jgi:hypothetical protein